jgi:hypothetical protein
MARYPHTLIVKIPAEGTQDTEGNLTVANTEELYTTPCRDEAGAGAILTLADGTDYIFQSLIYFPRSAEFLPAGTLVQITDQYGIRAEGTIKRFARGDKNSRAWL